MKRWLSSPFGPLELIMGMFLLLWGGWIASPWWSAYAATPAFRILSLIVPAWLAGGLPIAVAVLLLIAKYKHWPKLRHVVLFVIIGYFLFSSILFFLSSPASTAWIAYLTISAIFAFLLFYDLGDQ